MNVWLKRGLIVGAVLLAVLSVLGYYVYNEIQKATSEDPTVWAEDIEKLVTVPVKEQAVLFIGSSSIRLWDTLDEDMAPLPVIRRGFGGAKMNDVAYYAEQLLQVPNPLAIVVFAGTNDIHPGATKSASTLLTTYQSFISTVRKLHPETPVYYIAITPSPMRWEVWEQAQKVNRAITEYSDAKRGLYVIDTAPALLNDSGQPDKRFYRFDKLHLSKEGYKRWAEIIRGRLLTDLNINVE